MRVARPVSILVALAGLAVGCSSEETVVAGTSGHGGQGGGTASEGTLQWDAPTTNTDGSPLTDLAGYRLYRGQAPGAYTDSQDLGMPSCTDPVDGTITCTYPLGDLPSGEHYFALTAYNAGGYESLFSNEIHETVP